MHTHYAHMLDRTHACDVLKSVSISFLDENDTQTADHLFFIHAACVFVRSSTVTSALHTLHSIRSMCYK